MSEPRKSRREAKPTQRLKEFLGEETSKSSTPKASKLLAKTVATPRAPAKNEKLTATKSPPEKASPGKKGAVKPAAISKVTPAKAATAAGKAARNAALSREDDSKPSAVAPRTNVTQSVKKTSIKEAKKAPATKGLVEKEPEILRTKRVPKPSAKVAEALEAEAEAEQVIKKPVLAPSPKVAKPALIKMAAHTAGRGSRGRGASGLKDRGRGRGRGRGRSFSQPKFQDEEEEEEGDEMDIPGNKDLSEDEQHDDVEDKMDVDEAEEEEDELEDDDDEEEGEEEDDDDEPPLSIANKLKKGQTKLDSVVKKSVPVTERNSCSELTNKGSNDAPAAVKATLTGAVLNPIVKKVVSSASSPVKVTSQAPRRDIDSSNSPTKSSTVKQVGRGSSGGVKRFLTAASPLTSPLAKKLKLSSDESASTGGSEASSPASVPSKPASVKTQPIAIVTSSSSAAAANGVRQKVATVKTVAKTIPTSAKLQSKAALNKMESGMANDSAENRRSRRQPKPTERMKEFLHKSSEEDEGDEDDPSALMDDNDMDSEEDLDDDEEEDEEDDGEESSRRFLEFMNKAAGGQKNKRPEAVKGPKIPAGAAKASPQKFIKTQLIRKGSQSGPAGRGGAAAGVMQNKVGNAIGGALKAPKVVQVQTSKFTPGSKVMVQPPSSVNGNMRKGTTSGMLSSSSSSSSGGGGNLRVASSKKTEPQRVPSEPPVIIKIRTRKPEEDETLRKKREEEDKQAGTRKIIKIYTRLGSGQKVISRGRGSKSSADLESDSMESDEEDSENEDSADPKGPKPLSGKNVKLIRMCEEAVESLKRGLKSHKKEQNQSINSKTIEKFIRLSSEITDTVKETINELGDKISNSDNFEEYCQDVLDSISIKPNGDEISHEEADSLLSWLREQEKVNQKGGEARTLDRSSQLVLYSQMLEFLTAANDEGNEGTFDEDDEMDDEDEEMMDMDDEATYDKEYFDDAGEDGEEMDEDEAQEEEEEEDYLGEEEEMEDEEEAADDPPPEATKSAGRR